MPALLRGLIEGSKPGPMPGFIPPQLATLRTKVPAGDAVAPRDQVRRLPRPGASQEAQRNALHAPGPRLDGSVRQHRRVRWTTRLRPLIIDGEVIVEKDGRSNFSELQADLAAGGSGRMLYYVFDLLYLDGFDFTGEPPVD